MSNEKTSKLKNFGDTRRAIDAAAERKANHLKNSTCLRKGKGGKLRMILHTERTMFGEECDQW